jgi:beta-phosphoglucomutase-like phosphatase (HAD superfamily)
VEHPSTSDRLQDLLRPRPALLLDFDGLLVDSEPLHHEAFRRAFARFGHAVDAQEYWLYFTHLGEGPAGEIRRHGLERVPAEVVVRDKAAIFSALCELHPPSPRPGAMRLLRLLARLGWPHAIASNTDRPDIERMLVHLQLEAPPPIVGGEGRLPGKPRPDIYLAAAAALGRLPTDCVAVEDTLKGVRAAVAAGMPCLAVPGPQTTGFEFPGAAAVLDGLDRISDALQAHKTSEK